MLEKEFEFYENNKSKIREKYLGKQVVIVGVLMFLGVLILSKKLFGYERLHFQAPVVFLLM
jgi:hypothetical protein